MKPIRLCVLGNPVSSHTVKWVNHFSAKGNEVHLVSFEEPRDVEPEVVCHRLATRWQSSTLRYFVAGNQLREIIRSVQPDLIHAHYAAGYGTLGRLSRFRPYVLSVWGSDVFEVPAKSPLHRRLIAKNVKSADHVCSTSKFMAEHTKQFYAGPITVTPFGVDCGMFRPFRNGGAETDEVVVGTVRSLEKTYGVEHLIKAFALLVRKYGNAKKLRLLIAGDGSQRKHLQSLARELGIGPLTDFLGTVPQREVPAVLNRMDVFVAVSLFETFGVAVLEASACRLPVVASAAPGLSEVIQENQTALVVPPADEVATAEAIAKLIDSSELRRQLGAAGREFVATNYSWSTTAAHMERLYESLLGLTNDPCPQDISEFHAGRYETTAS